MPVYEYRCGSCGKSFDMLRRIAEMDDMPLCIHCYARKTARVVATRFSTRRSVAAALAETQPKGYDAYIKNAKAWRNGGAGVYIGPGVRVKSEGLHVRDNAGPGVENHGYFDGPDTKFE